MPQGRTRPGLLPILVQRLAGQIAPKMEARAVRVAELGRLTRRLATDQLCRSFVEGRHSGRAPSASPPPRSAPPQCGAFHRKSRPAPAVADFGRRRDGSWPSAAVRRHRSQGEATWQRIWQTLRFTASDQSRHFNESRESRSALAGMSSKACASAAPMPAARPTRLRTHVRASVVAVFRSVRRRHPAAPASRRA